MNHQNLVLEMGFAPECLCCLGVQMFKANIRLKSTQPNLRAVFAFELHQGKFLDIFSTKNTVFVFCLTKDGFQQALPNSRRFDPCTQHGSLHHKFVIFERNFNMRFTRKQVDEIRNKAIKRSKRYQKLKNIILFGSSVVIGVVLQYNFPTFLDDIWDNLPKFEINVSKNEDILKSGRFVRVE